MNNNKQQNKNQNELGALWKKRSKNGMSFLSGYVKVDDLGLEKEIKVVVFANSNKANEKAPDYRIYISKPLSGEPNQLDNSDSQLKPKKAASAQKKAVAETAETAEIQDEDIL